MSSGSSVTTVSPINVCLIIRGQFKARLICNNDLVILYFSLIKICTDLHSINPKTLRKETMGNLEDNLYWYFYFLEVSDTSLRFDFKLKSNLNWKIMPGSSVMTDSIWAHAHESVICLSTVEVQGCILWSPSFHCRTLPDILILPKVQEWF